VGRERISNPPCGGWGAEKAYFRVRQRGGEPWTGRPERKSKREGGWKERGRNPKFRLPGGMSTPQKRPSWSSGLRGWKVNEKKKRRNKAESSGNDRSTGGGATGICTCSRLSQKHQKKKGTGLTGDQGGDSKALGEKGESKLPKWDFIDKTARGRSHLTVPGFHHWTKTYSK